MAGTIRRGIVSLAVLTVLGVSASGQQPQPTFKTNVNAIMVDFRVVDANGAFVDNLTSNDIQVFEDGKPQDISSFDLVKIPMDAVPEQTFAGRPVAPDTQSNDADSQRVYVLVLDDALGDPLRAQTVRALARKFVAEYMRPTDRVALTTTNGRKDVTVEFTGDKVRLTNAIDKFQGGFGPQTGNESLYQLRALTNWLSFEGHRKAIVFIGETLGGNLPLSTTPSQTANLLDEVELAKAETNRTTIFEEFSKTDGAAALDLRDVIGPAERNNVAIYAIDPTGAPGSSSASIKPVAFLSEPGSFKAVRPMLRSDSGQDSLAVLAVETGGAALLQSNNFDGAFSRIVSDASSYYLLGYASANAAQDGKFRKLDVRTRPGLYVRARTGYVAPGAKAAKGSGKLPAGWSSALTSVIQSPIQVAGLTMDVGAAVFRGSGKNGNVEVIVETRPNALGLVESGNQSKGGVGLALAVADADGHVKAAHHGDLDMQLKGDLREKVDDFGVRFLTQLKLKPGQYTMRVGSADAVNSHDGSVHYALDVPNFSKGSITMSGLLIESPAENQRPTTGQDKDWHLRYANPPTAARRFWNRDEITVVGEVYNNENKKDPITVTTTVKDENDAVVFKQQDTLTGDDTYSRKVPISLKGLAAGRYLLTMEARNLSKAKAMASRQVLFSVAP